MLSYSAEHVIKRLLVLWIQGVQEGNKLNFIVQFAASNIFVCSGFTLNFMFQTGKILTVFRNFPMTRQRTSDEMRKSTTSL